MAYAAITSLITTILDFPQHADIYLQPFIEKLKSFRAIIEKPCNITGDLEVLTMMEAEIIELLNTTEDMIILKTRKAIKAKTTIKRRVAFWRLRSLLKRAPTRIHSKMNKWLAMQNSKDLRAQNLIVANTSQHDFQSENMMVGHENAFEIMQDQLARGATELQVISIVGMGGIGKSTLAIKLYNDPFIMSHFDIRAKVIVSQEYCKRNVLLGILSSISGSGTIGEFYEQQDDGQLADRLQKYLKGKRYLIVIDDIWTTIAWDDVKLCFPDCNCGSRILLTTRNMKVAEYASSGNPPYQMRLLNFNESWYLLHKKVFENTYFPPEFENIGKQIALNCKGLPLAIVVIAGLLLKIGQSLDEWENIAENIVSMVSTDPDVPCMRMLALSYHHLPHHLKPCFLYFAIFPEDELIFVNKLVKLWAAEGFLKREREKSIEEVAEQYLKDLVDRGLIFIRYLSFDGKIKACGMHDMIRELCLREARKLNFVNVIMENQNPCEQSMHFSTKRRICIQSEESSFVANQLAMVLYNKAHSILLFIRNPSNSGIMQELERFKKLRILELASPTLDAFPSCIVGLFQLRYLALTFYSSTDDQDIYVPPSINGLQYLQSLILKFPKYFRCPKFSFILPSQIFNLWRLRHLSLDRNNSDTCEFGERSLILNNMQCLSGWNPLCCTSSVFKQFPNLKKLQISGDHEEYITSYEMKGLHNLCNLDQLEELKFDGMPHSTLPHPEAFPKNLKKLSFSKTHVNLEDLRILSKLPKLEALKLKFCSSNIGMEWEVTEEGFPQLKFLLLSRLGIRHWRASSDHFPRLERLFLVECANMISIPEDFVEITTLQLIDIRMCKESVVNSAKKIQQEIEDNYGGSIEVCFRYVL
ncbi:putative late blight resistance protein homolog R1B-16 [Nicotiana sylvestris]|uniref:Late blight resistance protein homolog R1B-16 n=1 Tax=Nicotiana sylvestris TaxID=4096 RepID=A0A1U7XDU2_NICSY|nr:PREDICTED: putative late blight resistance protein homolog R1B-16 [Nicotiana sylvestris]